MIKLDARTARTYIDHIELEIGTDDLKHQSWEGKSPIRMWNIEFHSTEECKGYHIGTCPNSHQELVADSVQD